MSWDKLRQRFCVSLILQWRLNGSRKSDSSNELSTQMYCFNTVLEWCKLPGNVHTKFPAVYFHWMHYICVPVTCQNAHTHTHREKKTDNDYDLDNGLCSKRYYHLNDNTPFNTPLPSSSPPPPARTADYLYTAYVQGSRRTALDYVIINLQKKKKYQEKKKRTYIHITIWDNLTALSNQLAAAPKSTRQTFTHILQFLFRYLLLRFKFDTINGLAFNFINVLCSDN